MIRSTSVVTKRTPVTRRGMVVAQHPLGAGESREDAGQRRHHA